MMVNIGVQAARVVSTLLQNHKSIVEDVSRNGIYFPALLSVPGLDPSVPPLADFQRLPLGEQFIKMMPGKTNSVVRDELYVLLNGFITSACNPNARLSGFEQVAREGPFPPPERQHAVDWANRFVKWYMSTMAWRLEGDGSVASNTPQYILRVRNAYDANLKRTKDEKSHARIFRIKVREKLRTMFVK